MRIFHVVCVTNDDRLRAYEVSAPARASRARLLKLVRAEEKLVRLKAVDRVICLPERAVVLRQLSYIP